MTRVKISLKDTFGDFEEKMQKTTVVEDVDETIDCVLMTVVKALIGHGFSEDLVKMYINYSPEDYEINKIENQN